MKSNSGLTARRADQEAAPSRTRAASTRRVRFIRQGPPRERKRMWGLYGPARAPVSWPVHGEPPLLTSGEPALLESVESPPRQIDDADVHGRQFLELRSNDDSAGDAE